MEYLLDTNTCIYIIKKKPIEVLERFQALSLGSVGISTITLAELQYGVAKSASPEKNQQVLQQFLIPLELALWICSLQYTPKVWMSQLSRIMKGNLNECLI